MKATSGVLYACDILCEGDKIVTKSSNWNNMDINNSFDLNYSM